MPQVDGKARNGWTRHTNKAAQGEEGNESNDCDYLTSALGKCWWWWLERLVHGVPATLFDFLIVHYCALCGGVWGE
jgi:hypothetical protein